MPTVITTGGRPDWRSEQLAKEAAAVLGYPVVERKKRSVARLQQEYRSDVIVAGKERFDLYRVGMDEPFFFHPNSAAFRLKRLLKGESDPLVEVSQLKQGDSFLDCTLGLASDSIVASFITGDSGKITGIEADPAVAFITGRGLRTFPSESPQLVRAMGRIDVIHVEAVKFLREQADASWDIVYIDPMFHAPITESSNFTALRQVGVHSLLTQEWVEQAQRVCKRRVIVKDRFDSPVFEQFKLQQKIRPNTKFHFGFIEK
ncbi:class I SAM-dependent methyltransferase [Sporosarcina beigongshangi]|uniref:class I SAM-dependent methyltransferase n=1 Tax=Sporosarcina beigongshangi TaxID=2782538 RepID=UPI001BA59A7D|nr:class I SAM-dependent methyltransferase [Sporosarcina beigongshangi]